MNVRYLFDSSGEPHIYSHDVLEHEVEEALARAVETVPGRGVSRVAIGQTRAGRYLKVIYSRD